MIGQSKEEVAPSFTGLDCTSMVFDFTPSEQFNFMDAFTERSGAILTGDTLTLPPRWADAHWEESGALASLLQ